jgi:chromosomal replication initiator protein
VVEHIWQEFLALVSQEVGSRVVETWLKAVTLQRWDSIEQVAYVRAPNAFVKEWIQSHYTQLFQQHLARLFNVDTINVVFSDLHSPHEDDAYIPSVVPAQRIEPQQNNDTERQLVQRVMNKDRSHINLNYVFDTFVVGPSNSLAYAAAQAVSEKLGILYNPLFIYGGSGLGKTHLLHAIGNNVKKINEKASVLYQTADRFVNEFIHAIRFDKIHQFQAKYKHVDVLLIDDIQFFSNKDQTQEAFFHIFNTLYENHKQIVFTSDSYPADIHGLAERLSSRMQWGLVADIHTPAVETKVAILKRKAALSNEELPDDVAYFIAEHVTGNIRELEGSLIRVFAFAVLTKQEVSVELAKKVLLRKRFEPSNEPINIERIIDCIEKKYSCSLRELRSESRSRKLSDIRHIAMYLSKKLTNKSLQEIGGYFGRKDHTTVLSAFNKVKVRTQNDVDFKNILANLEREIIG